jgi:hypothetical protein
MPDPLLLSTRQTVQPWAVRLPFCACQCRDALGYEFLIKGAGAFAEKYGFQTFTPTPGSGNPTFEVTPGARYMVETVLDTWNYVENVGSSGKPPDTGSGTWQRVTVYDLKGNSEVQYSGGATRTRYFRDSQDQGWVSETDSGTVDPETGFFQGTEAYRSSLPLQSAVAQSPTVSQRAYGGNNGTRTETRTLSQEYTMDMVQQEHAEMVGLAPLDSLPDMCVSRGRRVRKVDWPTFPLEQNWTEGMIQDWIATLQEFLDGWEDERQPVQTAFDEARDEFDAKLEELDTREATLANLLEAYDADQEQAFAAYREYRTWTRRAAKGWENAREKADTAKATYDHFVFAGVPTSITAFV